MSQLLIRSAFCFCRRSKFSLQHPLWAAHSPITPAPGKLLPFSGLHRHPYTWNIRSQTHRHTYTFTKRSQLFSVFSYYESSPVNIDHVCTGFCIHVSFSLLFFPSLFPLSLSPFLLPFLPSSLPSSLPLPPLPPLPPPSFYQYHCYYFEMGFL